MLTNTVQSDLDNNLGVSVPYFKIAEDFLSTLKIEYQKQNGSLVLPGTSGTQQLFYATTEQKNQSWLNQGLADPQIAGLIIRTPLNPPKATEKTNNTRDQLTGLPLDDKGRYTKQVGVGDPIGGYKNYEPKFFSCATADCLRSGANLDMSDPGTQAYVKALDAQVFNDINTGSTLATLVTPVGIPGAVLSVVGLTTSVGSAATDSDVIHQAVKNSSQLGATEFFTKVLGHTPAAAARFVALIDLTGGWDSFTNRVKLDLFEIKPTESKDMK